MGGLTFLGVGGLVFMSNEEMSRVISHSSTREWMCRMALYPAVKMDLCSSRSSSCTCKTCFKILQTTVTGVIYSAQSIV